MSSDQAREHVARTLKDNHESLSAINSKIHQNPELRYQEHQAHDNICEMLQGLEFEIKRHAYGLDTSFEAEFGNSGRLVVFNAEYDALPGIGHACGHNLIAASSIAAFLATAELLKESGLPGRVRLLGTPAEESGGGKIKLIKAGAYVGVDACLMAHPGPSSMEYLGGKAGTDGVSATRSLARKQVTVTFTGKNAHAGLSPWHGKNALDAVVASYVNISLLRQQISPNARIHGVIRQGGAEPNIIPDSASLEYFIRESSAAAANDLAKRVENCFKAGALATDCSLDCIWNDEADYKDLRPNMTIARTFTEKMTMVGKDYLTDARSKIMGASTDMGNVCYEVPGFHCGFCVGSEGLSASPHDPKFAAVAGTASALENALKCAEGMALTAYDILTDDSLSELISKEFREEFASDVSD